MPYRVVEEASAADLAVEAWGKTAGELFSGAADAVLAGVVEDPARVRPEKGRTLELESDSLAGLLMRFLQEIVFLQDAEGLLLRFPEASPRRDGERWVLAARGRGEVLDRSRHEVMGEVKAVTYHRFRVEEGPEGYRAFFILDT